MWVYVVYGKRGRLQLSNRTSPLVTTAWLQEHLGASDVVPADCRFSLADRGAGAAAYRAGHIPGAVRLDLEADLSAPTTKGAHGGRHPLPDPDALAKKLGAAGIGPGVTVVAYDDDGVFASRLWWMLRYLGHDEVALLDGGLPGWRAAGGALTADPPGHPARTFTARPRPEMMVDIDAVKARSPAVVLLDARAGERYRGEVEPLDRVPGHIPGAVHAWWEEGLGADRRWLPPDAQRARFARSVGDRPAIAACGSGVSACADLVALALAGRWDVPLYVGSYSDWVSYPDNPVERG